MLEVSEYRSRNVPVRPRSAQTDWEAAREMHSHGTPAFEQLGDKNAWGLFSTVSLHSLLNVSYLNIASYFTEFIPRGAIMRENGEYILEAISLKSLYFLFLSTVFREPSTTLCNGLGVFCCLHSIFGDGS